MFLAPANFSKKEICECRSGFFAFAITMDISYQTFFCDWSGPHVIQTYRLSWHNLTTRVRPLSFRLCIFAVFNFSTLFQQHSGHGRFFFPDSRAGAPYVYLRVFIFSGPSSQGWTLSGQETHCHIQPSQPSYVPVTCFSCC